MTIQQIAGCCDCATGTHPCIQQLAAGLSTAKTIAEIRSAAKQILDETNGGDTDE